MLFFIDETWQTIAGQRVGALGAVAIPQDQYNGFCTAVYAMKKTVLGASELMHSEIKGQNCFTKSAFKRQALVGDSHWIKAADRMLKIMAAYEARTFVIWTTTPDLLTLRQRPELQPFVGRMLGLTYQFTRPGVSARNVRTARRVR